MARLPALVEAIAQHDYRPRSLIWHFGKTVRTAKLILSEKTGTGAADMTYADAATLLMAVGGAASPAGADLAVSNLRSLVHSPWDAIDEMKREDLSDDLDFMRPEMTFGVALETMIEHADKIWRWEKTYIQHSDPSDADGVSGIDMERLAEQARRAMAPLAPSIVRPVQVTFYHTGLGAEIHMGRPWMRTMEDNAFHEFYVAPADRFLDAPGATSVGTFTVGADLLLALKNAVDRPTKVIMRRPRSPEYR